MKELVDQLQELRSNYLASAGIEKVILHIDGLIEAITELENRPEPYRGIPTAPPTPVRPGGVFK